MIERTLGYTNKAMWEYCERLKKVILQTRELKSGRGKSIEVREVLKYDINPAVISNIIDSCEHYKKLYEMEIKKVGSLEVSKYKFEYVNGKPKIIIEMVKVLDEDGDYIKFAKLEKVVAFLSRYPIKFKELQDGK